MATFLGLHYAIWLVLAVYFLGMLALGWWSRHEAKGREGYMMGRRQFGVPMMVMHAFGAGTHPGDVAGVMSGAVRSGPSGIWISWMWMFGTPFYWLIGAVVRRMRCLTLADFFEERFSRRAAVLYTAFATIGMTVCAASCLLATTRTVQGMMSKVPPHVSPAEADAWFFGILFVTTGVFMAYSHWGGIIATIRTDFVQGILMVVLSFLAIPKALELLGGWPATVQTLRAKGGSYLSLFYEGEFSALAVVLLCINAPFSILAQPHLMTMCGAGKTEWEGRVGFTYGAMLKRVCTMGWCILGLCWVAYLFKTTDYQQPTTAMADAAFGNAVQELLPVVLQGVMLACVLAAGMSTGSAIQVTVAALFSQNVYRHYIRPDADDERVVWVTKLTGLVIIAAAMLVAILMRGSVVKAILEFFNLTGVAGVAVGLGILWRRMNVAGVFASIIAGSVVFILTRIPVAWMSADPANSALVQALVRLGLVSGGFVWTHLAVYGLPLFTGLVAGIVGSLVTRPPDAALTDKFFRKIYVPIGQEAKLDLPLDQAVPPEKRLCTAGGLFLVKPSRQSWVGFLVTLGICLALVGLMFLLLRL
ncbi:MAG: sodium:solute symporter family protein [Planctomycetes bacterium]|nr:sodium:solute symporter family protein [Planctomycetota bacterium]